MGQMRRQYINTRKVWLDQCKNFSKGNYHPYKNDFGVGKCEPPRCFTRTEWLLKSYSFYYDSIIFKSCTLYLQPQGGDLWLPKEIVFIHKEKSF